MVCCNLLRLSCAQCDVSSGKMDHSNYRTPYLRKSLPCLFALFPLLLVLNSGFSSGIPDHRYLIGKAATATGSYSAIGKIGTGPFEY